MTTILEHVAYAFIYGFIGTFGVAIASGLLRWVPVHLTIFNQARSFDAPPSESE